MTAIINSQYFYKYYLRDYIQNILTIINIQMEFKYKRSQLETYLIYIGLRRNYDQILLFLKITNERLLFVTQAYYSINSLPLEVLQNYQTIQDFYEFLIRRQSAISIDVSGTKVIVKQIKRNWQNDAVIYKLQTFQPYQLNPECNECEKLKIYNLQKKFLKGLKSSDSIINRVLRMPEKHL